MPDNTKTEEFLQKLTPCIERRELDECVEEAVRLAGEMGVGAEYLIVLCLQIARQGVPISRGAAP